MWRVAVAGFHYEVISCKPGPGLWSEVTIMRSVWRWSTTQSSPVTPSSRGEAWSRGSWSRATGRGRAVWRRAAPRGPVHRPGGPGRCRDRGRARGRHTAAQRTWCSWCCRPSAGGSVGRWRGSPTRRVRWCCNQPHQRRSHSSSPCQLMPRVVWTAFRSLKLLAGRRARDPYSNA